MPYFVSKYCLKRTRRITKKSPGNYIDILFRKKVPKNYKRKTQPTQLFSHKPKEQDRESPHFHSVALVKLEIGSLESTGS